MTVIVPIFRPDPFKLQGLLRALQRQTLPANQFQVYIVNNDPNTRVELVLHTAVLNYTIINEARVGAYAARNAAVGQCATPLIVFTDSDCLPEPSWLLRYVETTLASKSCLIMGGAISFSYQERRVNTCADYDSRMHLRQADYLARGFAATANMATCKDVFDVVGPFDDRFYSGEDENWARRARLAGYVVRSVDNAEVVHPARQKLIDLLRKNRRGCGPSKLTFSSVGEALLAELNSLPARWRRLWIDSKKTSRVRRASLSALFVLVECVRLAEILRLRTGSSPERR